MSRRDLWISQVDSNEDPSTRLTFDSDSRNGETRSDLDRHNAPSLNSVEPIPVQSELSEVPSLVPIPVVEHQDIWPGDAAAVGADRQRGSRSDRGLIDLNSHAVGRPDPAST